jgi:hypothetical protein
MFRDKVLIYGSVYLVVYFNAHYHLKSKDRQEVIQYMVKVGEVMTVQTSYSKNNLQMAYLFKNFS